MKVRSCSILPAARNYCFVTALPAPEDVLSEPYYLPLGDAVFRPRMRSGKDPNDADCRGYVEGAVYGEDEGVGLHERLGQAPRKAAGVIGNSVGENRASCRDSQDLPSHAHLSYRSQGYADLGSGDGAEDGAVVGAVEEPLAQAY